jgi:uncharacterized membrane protein
MRKSTKLVFVAAGLGLSAWWLWQRLQPLPAVRYRLVDLGSLGNGALFPVAVNESGQVVGVSMFGDCGTAFSWTEREGLVDLTEVCDPLRDASSTQAFDVDEKGRILLVARRGKDHYTAYLWGGNKDVHEIVSGDALLPRLRLNNSGLVAGTMLSHDQSSTAFFWSASQGFSTIVSSSPECFLCGAWALNQMGNVAGRCLNPAGLATAFIWNPKEGMTDLGALPGNLETCPTDLNDNGDVAGFGPVDTDAPMAFFWSATRGIEILPASGTIAAVAAALNDREQVVGFYRTSLFKSKRTRLWVLRWATRLFMEGPNLRGDSRACLWEKGSLLDLNTLVPADSGWKVLLEASGINEKGQIIGRGVRNDGTPGGFFLDPLPDRANNSALYRQPE